MTESSRNRDLPAIAATRGELRRRLRSIGAVRSRRRAVVMTMGALHDGHGELMAAAREVVGPTGHVTVTIFVNPLQFGATEDLDTYPRTFAADIDVCRTHNVDLVFVPTPEVVYPHGDPAITVNPGELGMLYEGLARPTHFRGVLTVVSKLLALTCPDYALFGEKDYQQLTLVRQLVRDLDFEVEIIGVPIVRAADGLALSSRNKYLSSQTRTEASAIPTAITAAQSAAAAGKGAEGIVSAAQSVLVSAPGVNLEYIVLTDPAMGPPPAVGEARIIIAATVGDTRLLDNARVDIRDGK